MGTAVRLTKFAPGRIGQVGGSYGCLNDICEPVNEFDAGRGSRDDKARLPLHLLISESGSERCFDPNADPNRENNLIDRRYSAAELRAVIAEAEALIGDTLDDLVQRHRQGVASPATPPSSPHRLVDLLLRLRRAADDPDDGLAESAAAVAIAEVGGILEIFEVWRSDPAWPEFQ